LVSRVLMSSVDRQNVYGKIPRKSASRAPVGIRVLTFLPSVVLTNRTRWNTCGGRDETEHRIAGVSMTQTLRHALPHKSGRDHNTSGGGNPCQAVLRAHARKRQDRERT